MERISAPRRRPWAQAAGGRGGEGALRSPRAGSLRAPLRLRHLLRGPDEPRRRGPPRHPPDGLAAARRLRPDPLVRRLVAGDRPCPDSRPPPPARCAARAWARCRTSCSTESRRGFHALSQQLGDQLDDKLECLRACVAAWASGTSGRWRFATRTGSADRRSPRDWRRRERTRRRSFSGRGRGCSHA